MNSGSGADDVVDDDGPNTINGGTGDDRLDGESGDTIDGGPDSDICNPSGTSCTSSYWAVHECPT
ncbi:hypothetical protein L6R53_06120 [Myxococcota bacterium]|nr:hypothetical protein [Myxococcota bacterium]